MADEKVVEIMARAAWKADRSDDYQWSAATASDKKVYRDDSRRYLSALRDGGCEVTLRTIDPRDPDPTREGIFRDHNCWKCDNGNKPCVQKHSHHCEYPHARND